VDKDLVEQIRPEEEPGEVLEQPNGQESNETHEQSGEQESSGSVQLTQGSQETCEQPIVHIKDLPQGPGSLKDNAHSSGSGYDHRKGKKNGEANFVQASELLSECNTKEEKEESGKVHGQPPKQRKNTTRALILQALTNNLTKLKDIAYFAAVDPSTAHYHLRNLIRQERVIKLSWGRYAFPDSPALKETGQFFEKFLRNSSQSIRVNTGYMELHPTEKNILVDILSKDNRYLQLSERELARRNNISRYKVKKYTHKLEKKRLITIEREGKQLIYTPTQVAISAFSAFLHSEKTGSKIDSSSSKVQPITSKKWPITNEKGGVSGKDVLQDQFSPGVPEDVGHQGIPSAPGTPQNEYLTLGTAPEDPGHPDTSPQNVLQTFEDYIAWQQKNAHRLIIQFKLLRCNHNRLKGTGWIFGKKSIHKHFTEAFIFKSKDPSKEIINVLPKKPFIFVSPFEFEDQIITFVNEVIDRLKEYGITIDLSEPAEIRLEHVALEDDIFARKVVKKGLLYFKSKIQTVDSTGELIEYVIKIDKSKKLHAEFEGREAHHMAETYEAFIDDVVSGKIDRKDLREMSHTVKGIKTQVKEEFEKIEKKLSSNVEKIHTTQAVLHNNQLEFSQNLVSHTKMVKTIEEAAESVNKAADTIREVTESLKECLQLFRKGMESLTSKNSGGNISGNSGGIE